MNETELLPMRHTIGVVNGRINSSRSGGDDEETCTLEKPYSYTRRRRHIFVDVMQFYAWTLLPELSKTNNDHHHQVIFTWTTLIRIRAKEDQLLSLLSHIFRINLTRFIQIKIEIFFFFEEAGGKKCYITLSKFSSMNIYLTSLKLCHREVNNVLFAFHNLLIYVRRGTEEKEREKKKIH